jgi:hypothetical protein
MLKKRSTGGLYAFDLQRQLFVQKSRDGRRPWPAWRREVITATGAAIRRHLGDLHAQVSGEDAELDDLVQLRYDKFRRIGAWTE